MCYQQTKPERCIGYIEDQYSSKYHTFSPMISGDIWDSMSKKQGKIRFFDDVETDGGILRLRF